MKKLVEKFKGLNYKQLGIEHGEKLVLGFVLLIIVFALGGGTSWSHYANNPETLKKNAAQAAARIEAEPWPQAHQGQFPVGGLLTNRVQQMLAPLESNAFAFGDVAPYVPLYKPKEKIKNPGWLAIEQLIATYAPVVLVMPREAGFGGADPNNQFPGQPGGPKGGAEAIPGDELDGGLDGGLTNISAFEARGARVVAVRGVFPLNRQSIRMMRAMNISSRQSALAQLEFQSFEIERMTAVEGADPWAGKWEKLDLDEAFKILNEGTWIGDVVDTSITEAAFTEPLLQLLSGPGGDSATTSGLGAGPGAPEGGGPKAIEGGMGAIDVSMLGADNLWGALATHPSVKDYHLTPEGQEEQNLIDGEILEDIKTQQPVRKPGPLAKFQYNTRKGRDEMLGDQGAMLQFNRGIKRELGENGQLKRGVTASGKFLLFRFFDFTVEPGRAYRYRVRLIIINPNFGRPLQDVVDPSVVQEEYPKTLWSDPTAAVLVANEGDYFVSKINVAGVNGPEAIFDIFQWNEETGTTVHGVLKRQLGQLIDGLADDKYKPQVVDLGLGGIEERHVEFHTGSVFVDVEGDRRIPKDLHSDLDVPFSGKLGIVDQVLITNEYGDLEPLDSTTRSKKQAQVMADHEAFLEKHQSSAVGAVGGDPLAFEDPTADPTAADKGKQKKKRYGTSRRKRRPTGGAGIQPGSP
jgi:hypothetical protein